MFAVDGDVDHRCLGGRRGLLLTAIDGTVMSVADTETVRARYRKQRGNRGGAGYPALRLSVLLT
jgi:hypothetical protein